MAAVYTVQTLLMRMLRDAGAVSVAITPASDRTDKFLAGFTIDGQGPFVLATDKCKPRLLKNANEVESLIRRACMHVAALSVAWPDPAHLRKRANVARQAADDVALVGKAAALATGIAARRAKAAAVVEKINLEWADGAHKTERLADLAAEIAAADGWLAFAADGTLPAGGAVVVPDPVPDPDPAGGDSYSHLARGEWPAALIALQDGPAPGAYDGAPGPDAWTLEFNGLTAAQFAAAVAIDDISWRYSSAGSADWDGMWYCRPALKPWRAPTQAELENFAMTAEMYAAASDNGYHDPSGQIASVLHINLTIFNQFEAYYAAPQ